jgi:hypothetical protein
MPPHTLHVVQAFEQRDGGIVPLEPKACPSAASARGLANRLARDPRRRHRVVEDGRS